MLAILALVNAVSMMPPSTMPVFMNTRVEQLVCEVLHHRHDTATSRMGLSMSCNNGRFGAGLLQKPIGYEGLVTCRPQECGWDKMLIYKPSEVRERDIYVCKEIGRSMPREWSCTLFIRH